ncbi:DUF732 domain-containing protein [Rhodococcus sp. BP22]|uniref:DUF732 domain-containing protein n=1 Tax=Rhodococcus sp. BP22 TaxID=2758566 RepID=UPI0016458F99|nr:DUF732 domain-containing protein [Rhodococcus sp. BP22]
MAIALTKHAQKGRLALILTDQRVLIYYVDPATMLPSQTTYAVILNSGIRELNLRKRTLALNGHQLKFKRQGSAATAASLLSDLSGTSVEHGEPTSIAKVTAKLPRAAKARKGLVAGLAIAVVAVAVTVGFLVVDGPDSSTADLADSVIESTSTAAVTTTSPTPPAPVETPATRQPSSSSNANAEFLSRVTDIDIFIEGSDKLKIGRVLCSSLERGDSTRSVVVQMQNAEYQPDEIGSYLGAATSTLCPSFYSSVERDLNSFLPGN